MKHTVLTLLAAILLSSCGGNSNTSIDDIIASKDLELIRKKKAELDASAQVIAEQLKQLETEIKVLDPQEKIPLITTFKAKAIPFDHYVELQGNVSTKQNVVLTAEYSGVLTKVYVKEGQRVRKGQLLAKIDDGGLSQQLAQVKIQADLAKTTFERQERLWQQKIGSEIQYLQAKSSYEAQEQMVSQIQEQVGKTQVVAPFSGTVDDVITEQGNVVSPGLSQLFRIVNLSDMYVETDVPERYITSIVPGKEVKVHFPVLGQAVDAKVRQAGNFINAANRTFKIEVGLPQKGTIIKPNLTAKLRINDYSNAKAILIPQSIISENAEGEQYVYTISQRSGEIAKAKRTIISTGKTQGDTIEVLSGIKSGDDIVMEGARSVQDGQDVKILEI